MTKLLLEVAKLEEKTKSSPEIPPKPRKKWNKQVKTNLQVQLIIIWYFLKLKVSHLLLNFINFLKFFKLKQTEKQCSKNYFKIIL